MANVPDRPSWGAHVLILELPAVIIRFHGLSRNQFYDLNKNYAGFVANRSTPVDIECDVHQLESSPLVSAAELTFAGQYAPKRGRCEVADSLSITGTNFKATFQADARTHSSLGVMGEEELAYANVIENYLRIISAHRVLGKRGVVLHSAGLVFNEKAYIFVGRSNAGKTTLTRKAYKIGARVLSDDINLVLPGETGYYAYSVPFTGEFGRTLDHDGGKESYPLEGIILLEQGGQLQTLPVSKSVSVARLLTGCPFVNTDELESDALFDSITGLVAKVPVIRLLNRREDSIDDIMSAVRKQFAAL